MVSKLTTISMVRVAQRQTQMKRNWLSRLELF